MNKFYSKEKETIKFNKDVEDRFVMLLQQFPVENKSSAILPMLNLVQALNNGWLNKDIITGVANYLNVSETSIYAVVSFYSMLKMEPVGKYHIKVCHSISCKLTGSEDILNFLSKRLNIKVGNTSKNGMFTLEKTECIASCINSPSIIINNKYYNNISIRKLDNIINDMEKEIA